MTGMNIKIGGAAGQGLQRAGFLLGKTFVRNGYHVFAIQDSMSRVRGGHNFFQLRVSDEPIAAMTDEVDLLVALDEETIDRHRSELKPDGLLLFDGATLGVSEEGPPLVDLQLQKLAVEHGGLPIFANSAVLGFILGLVDLGISTLTQIFEESFIEGDLAEKNSAVAAAGCERARAEYDGRFESLAPIEGPRRMFVNGNEAIALGAIAAGLKFMSAYPMSPSTGIIEYIAGKEEQLGVVTEQAEDEIAAINLAFGASMAGVRAMTATSGGGLVLMSETISLIGAAEVPLVIVDSQRPGPATGLPTRTEQGDLLLAIHSGHGEFPRAVLAPGNAEQAFHGTVRAFNLADRFQIPVILLAEQHLSDSYYTVVPFDLDLVENETSLLDAEDLAELSEYKRYRITADGVSPRAWPGQSRHPILTDSHEHDETGHITEDARARRKMVEKRLRKNDHLRRALASPERVGPEDTTIVLVGWGSTWEVLREAVVLLRERGIDAGLVHFHDLWPFPTESAIDRMGSATRLIAVEGNATGQLAGLIRQHTGRTDVATVLKYDGRPFLVGELLRSLEGMVRS